MSEFKHGPMCSGRLSHAIPCTDDDPLISCYMFNMGHAAGQALGEKLATERIVAALRRAAELNPDQESPGTNRYAMAADWIQSGDHIASGAHDAKTDGVKQP